LGGNLLAFHVCDWKTPTEDLLLDRGLMGEGCINLREIRGWVDATGYRGFIEVEIFSKKYWAMDQKEFLDLIIAAYRSNV
jgi:sugar phosphate isomerase/epimerase